jgi:hypothetical protein
VTTLDQALAAVTSSGSSELRTIAMRGWEPGVQFVDGKPAVITTAGGPQLGDQEYDAAVSAMGVTIPDGYRLRLSEARFDPVAWTREHMFVDDEREGGGRTKAPAVTRAVWRYRFVVELDLGASLVDADLAAMVKQAKAAGRGRPVKPLSATATMTVTLGDLQISKVDVRGGTQELLERLEIAKRKVVMQIRNQKPAQLVLVDGGDIIEGFESSPSADRTNDLSQVQQLRLARRILWDWVSTLAPLVEDMKVVGVPSNHCQVRRGKQVMGQPDDDYGLENIIAVSDIAAANTVGAYDHVTFIVPPKFDEAVAFELPCGKIWGAAHGHQVGSPDKFGDYFAKQALGRAPVGQADFLFVFHFHQLRVTTVGDDRWVFISPTMDNGSSWYRNNNGSESRPGVLTIMLDEHGWRDLYVAWAD